MRTVFVGGSRHVTRLPDAFRDRIDEVMRAGDRIVVGDAAGADKAVQKHLHEAAYDAVTVFCSGDSHRNNLGGWTTRRVAVPSGSAGFQFHAIKDRAMAEVADFGLMVWDGKSPGTVLNVLRLRRAGVPALLFSVPERRAIEFRTDADWETFLENRPDAFIGDLRARATNDEWAIPTPSVMPAPDRLAPLRAALAGADLVAVANALATLDRYLPGAAVDRASGQFAPGKTKALELGAFLTTIAGLGLRLDVAAATGGAREGQPSDAPEPASMEPAPTLPLPTPTRKPRARRTTHGRTQQALL